MNIAQQRAHFSIFIFLSNTEANATTKLHLASSGYDAYLFSDQEILIDRIKTTTPHVLVFEAEALLSPLSEFVEIVLKSNSEIQFVFVGPVSQSEAIAEYKEFNFSEFVPFGDFLETRILWAVDKTCEALYLTYMNEKLVEEKLFYTKEQKNLLTRIVDLQAKTEDQSSSTATQIIKRCHSGQSKDEVIQIFLEQISCFSIFFRFLPTVQTFVATAAKGLEIDAIKGIGARLTEEELKNLDITLEQGLLPKNIDDFMRNVLKVEKYFLRKIQPHKTLEAVAVFWKPEMISFAGMENCFAIFHLIYQNLHFLKRAELSDINDPVTELYNQIFFQKKIKEEVSRGQRLKLPVSLVLLSIDHFSDIEKSLGKNNRDLILKSIASIIQKTSRINDLSFRSDENEMALLLPHCQKKGATVRAERLRRLIETHSFTVNGLRVSVSAGISEYPSLCSSANSLESSARQALNYILIKEGNKVCLYSPPEDFKPDYEVSSV